MGIKYHMKKKLLLILLLLSINNICLADYSNDLKTLFLSNRANICGINIRNFNSQDLNNNGFIDNDEISGTFINAIERLDEVAALGINTLHVLPITPTGKLKALGTAGSVYSMSDFWNINPQLIDKNSELEGIEQAKLFIKECHHRNIRVIIDLPSCGAYDLFLTHPEFFIKDSKQCSVVPTDWTDVRLFNAGSNTRLNQDLIKAHKDFIDLVFNIGADGIRADVATIKPFNFWVEIINYAKSKDPEFMFLAEASDSWREPPSKYAPFTPYNKLLEAGFDGYYGSFFNLKDWNSNNFIEHIKFNLKLLNSYKDKKSVIMSFTTHDEVSPVLLHGKNFSKIITWLNATLPFNPYCIDGFFNGEDYIYPMENEKAPYSQTDDDTFFVHRGKLDIFNFSKKPDGKDYEILDNFINANKFRNAHIETITEGEFIPIETNNLKVFAFLRTYKNNNILVIGNLDFKIQQNKITLKIPNINKNTNIETIYGNDNIKTSYKKLYTDLQAGEIKVLLYKKG